MFRRMGDFASQWKHESDATMKVMRSLTDAALTQPIVPGGRTLGFLAWHIVGGLGSQMTQLGVPLDVPPADAPVPGVALEVLIDTRPTTAVR